MKASFIASQNVRALLATAALAVGLGACGGGSGSPTGAAGTGGGAGTGGSACDVPAIFNSYGCATPACHGGPTPAAAFAQDVPGWETAMVGKAAPGGGPQSTASMCMGKVYLVAGSQPATGLFMDKLKMTTPVCGARMPNIGGPLTSHELDCVQTWADALTKPK
jgi:hypothetical protein